MLQEHLRFTLLIIGFCFIGGVLLHGMWSIHKNSKKNKRGSFESRNWEPDFEHEDDLEIEGPIFDDVGVSRARIIKNPSGKDVSDHNEVSELPTHETTIDADAFDDGSQLATNASDASQQKPEDLSFSNSSISDEQDEESIHVSQVTVSMNEPFDESIAPDPRLNVDTDNSISDTEAKNVMQAAEDEQELVSEPDTSSPVKISPQNVAESSKQNDPHPVYSNVVTQPKPEYTKPTSKGDSKDFDFGQPPGFLLKKGEEQSSDGHHSRDHQSNNENIASHNDGQIGAGQDDSTQAKPSVNAPDFSLNIQDGPKNKNAHGTSESSSQAEIKSEELSSTKPGVEKELSFAEQAKRFVRRNKKTVADKIRKEPVIKNGPADDQMRIDFDDSAAKSDQAINSPSQAAPSVSTANTNTNSDNQNGAESQTASTATDVLVLNVRANNDQPIEGAALLPMLLTLGFKFGEHDIFHRHVNTNGKGPILFSLTNMFKPGVFDIDKLENFNTLGLSLFMMLPIEGDAQQVFNMMHNAARKLSDEFDCRILDGNKVGLSKQSLQQYVERIREFERKRLNR